MSSAVKIMEVSTDEHEALVGLLVALSDFDTSVFPPHLRDALAKAECAALNAVEATKALT